MLPSKDQNLSRRRFLQASSATSAAVLSAGVWSSRGHAESNSANEQLNIACIGTANRALNDINGVTSESIVALCDVDSRFLDVQAKRFPDAKTYADYREMLDESEGKVDAVVIGITDHHHAPATIRAIEKKMHVYCEKPLTHTVEEARIVTEAARQAGVATQMGTQIHATDNYRRVVEIVRSGAIGDVNEVHVWVGKGWGAKDAPSGNDPAPAYLDWDLWLGPAAERPYIDGQYHPAQWRRWWDFGQGTLGDMACHYMDLPFWALGLTSPTRVAAAGPPVHAEACPQGLKVNYEFPAIENRGPVRLTWYDGNLTPRTVSGIDVPGSGVMFVGSEGKMFANYGSYKLYPEQKYASFTPPPKTIADSIGHHAEWIRACKTGEPTTCNFDYAGPLTESVLLGNVAFRAGKPIEWDAAKLQVIGNEQANGLVGKEYRPGWEVRALETVS
ncbi:Gfo/Idh/MocA family protein [Allorhodopirellula solitaria]|uniref:Inositol 2-dehydrogenase n=1 Tax=Allorhodopirellula solitaria TaxID=2527987 RepID=A0A5C5YFL8_9BACT|nr:Gfo/Idh/MocA family oxidoreductase [Allorhodopirellula solitaria]TWT74080.1 Inositol 2-dehydrogenase [Allorhodopirellula solitaria]